MRDRSKQLLVINTGKKQSEQTGMTSQSGTTHIIGGGGLSVNISDYLLKSIWDKVFEIRTDSQGTEYIFGKLPVVTQSGITMYSGDGVDIPSLASGLPFDGRTIWYNPDTNQIEVIGGTGGGSGEGVSNFWDLSGIPSWITNSKPKYTYSEIEGTPDLTKYALVSQIPSLSGYATESWVLQKNYATKATTLSGYGITDAYTKRNVDDLLLAYVTLGGRQTITGEKNFTGGLKVNGSPIYYDTEKKYWKLEGDLLVTGGVTMYGSDSSFTPSTIMDALLYDDTTLGINSNGQLYVKGGGTSGGGLDITALQNYLTQNSYLNVTEGDGRYLRLSGGTINGKLTIKNSTREALDIISTDIYGPLVKLCYYNDVALSSFGHIRKATESNLGAYWMNNESGCGIMLGSDGKTYIFTNQVVKAEYEIWHKGNFTPSNYLPLSGGTMTGNILLGGTTTNKIGTNIVNTSGGYQEFTHQNSHGYIAIGPFNDSVAHIYTDRPSFYFNKDLYVNNAKVWNASNDGSGSTLDADLLDGKHLSDIIRYEGLNNNGNNAASAQTITYWGEGNWGHGSTYGTSLNIQGAGSWNHRIDFRTDGILDYYQGINTGDMTHIGAIAFTSSNVSSATKLQTARTIWGQSFDGTGDIEGAFRLIFPNIPGDAHVVHSALKYKENPYGLLTRIYNDGAVSLQVQRESNVNEVFTLLLNPHGGNVGIGTTLNVGHKLAVNGDSVTKNIRTQSIMLGYSEVSSSQVSDRRYYASITYENEGQSPSYLNPALVFKTMNNTYQQGTEVERMRICSNGNLSVGYAGNKGSKLYVDGNILAYGGITMYSDLRKKTILNHVELSLKQIADAPLIEHYYNSDEKRTTHVGSIAQYWASMNDWFCKLDSEGYYTMEIQNAALASAISIARELDRYETKTDKAIKKLKKRICELEEELERLKSA